MYLIIAFLTAMGWIASTNGIKRVAKTLEDKELASKINEWAGPVLFLFFSY